MMKKRLLALALCLVLVSSLLPITVLADEFTVNSVCAVGNGSGNWLNGERNNPNATSNLMKEVAPKVYEITYNRVNEGQYGLMFYVNGTWIFKGSFKSFGTQTPVARQFLGESMPIDFTMPYDLANITLRFDLSNYDHNSNQGATFTITITEVHDWQFTVSENHDTLTAECQNENCKEKVSVSLKADSVTLPTSPFNARLEGKQEFEDATGAEIGEIVYKCNKEIVTDQSNPKAGQYQAWVMIKNLPGPVYQDGVAALAEDSNTKSTAELFVHYTAADPAVTAQTGDNRPIELMLVCALAFSALAAAAFILDSKRKYSR